MKLIKIIITILLIMFTSSFCFFKKKPRDYEDMANEISIKVAKKLMSRHKMDWIGEGGGMMGSVYMISLSFQIHHAMTEDEARIRIVDCVEEILTEVNSNEEIRPFLKNFPFTTKNIHVSIYTNEVDGKEVFDPFIRVVSLYQSDKISYSTKEPNKIQYKRRYYENYAEALEIVSKNKASFSSN